MIEDEGRHAARRLAVMLAIPAIVLLAAVVRSPVTALAADVFHRDLDAELREHHRRCAPGADQQPREHTNRHDRRFLPSLWMTETPPGANRGNTERGDRNASGRPLADQAHSSVVHPMLAFCTRRMYLSSVPCV